MKFIINGNEHKILTDISTHIDNLPMTREKLKYMSEWGCVFAGFCCDGIDKFLDKLQIVCIDVLNHSAVNYNYNEDSECDVYKVLSVMFERLSNEIATFVQTNTKDKMLDKLIKKYNMSNDYLTLQRLFWDIAVAFLL